MVNTSFSVLIGNPALLTEFLTAVNQISSSIEGLGIQKQLNDLEKMEAIHKELLHKMIDPSLRKGKSFKNLYEELLGPFC